MAKANSNKRRAKAKAKPRAAVYYRMSTDDQDTSIDNQDRAVRKLAKAEYQVVVTYSDPGKSASKRKVKRSDFYRMLQDAAKGEFKVIICYDLTRFTRLDSLDAAPDLTSLRDAGVVIHTVVDGRLDMANDFDRIKLTFLIEHASREAKTIGRRSLDGRANKVKRGGPAGCRTPYGLAREVTDEKGKKKVYARLDKGTDRGNAAWARWPTASTIVYPMVSASNRIVTRRGRTTTNRPSWHETFTRRLSNENRGGKCKPR